MTFVVPFDGSDLAAAALVRAAELAAVMDESVVAVAAVPEGNADYARERGWLGPDEPFDLESVVGSLRERVDALAPTAEFRSVTVDRYAPPGTIAGRLRRVAREEDASMVFVGSENAGSLVTSISSVGGSVAAEDAYDVVIVRNARPSKASTLRDAAPGDGPGADRYDTE